MAISKIKKIEFIGLQKDKDNLLELLQKLAVVELIKPCELTLSPISDACEGSLLELEEAITRLAGFQAKSGLLEGLVKLKPLVYKQDLEELVSGFDYPRLLKNLSELRNHFINLTQHKERLIQETHLLAPWPNLSIPLEQIHSPTQNCGILSGLVRTSDYPNLLKNIDAENKNLFLEVISQDKTNSYILIIYISEAFERLELVLKEHHFNFIALSRHKGTVKDRLLEMNREIMVLDDQLREAKTKIEQLSPERFKLMAVYDYLANIKKRQEQESNLDKQQFTFSLSAWIREKNVRLFKGELAEKFQDIAIFISDPKNGEAIPTALENKAVIQPFEAVTNLYGQPLPGGLDPTGFLAPFFAVSFSFCMLDAGYGLILSGIMLFFLRKKQITAAGKNFLKLFLLMGITTIIAGLITGSFFGDLISRLPEQFTLIKNIQKQLTLFDPVKDSLVFLGLALALGFIQIWIGVFIKFCRDLRLDSFTAFILDLPTLLVQTSLLLLGLAYAGVLPAFTARFATASLILSALLIIYYQWKSNSEISLKIFWSIFGIYSIITGNFLADTLSFSRIFALGLTGGLLGMALNTMLFPKLPVTGGFAFIGALIAILILFAAHIINFAISLLGAYVHTSRLQYLEFFTKFFESGGRPFRPFKEETKYIFLAEK